MAPPPPQKKTTPTTHKNKKQTKKAPKGKTPPKPKVNTATKPYPPVQPAEETPTLLLLRQQRKTPWLRKWPGTSCRRPCPPFLLPERQRVWRRRSRAWPDRRAWARPWPSSPPPACSPCCAAVARSWEQRRPPRPGPPPDSPYLGEQILDHHLSYQHVR